MSKNHFEKVSDDLDFWVENSTRKIMEDENRTTESTQMINISAAKNEYEAAQIVIRPKKTIKNFQISFGDFRGFFRKKIPNKNIEVRYATYIYLPAFERTAPDPLPQFGKLDLKPNKNQPIYIIVKVPKNSSAGKYKAPITFKWDGGKLIFI